MKTKKQHKKPKGFMTLISVIIVGMVCLSISVFLLLASSDTSRVTSTLLKLKQAKSLANACAERGLEKLRQNPLYTGSEQFGIAAGKCGISAVTGSGNTNRSFKSTIVLGSITQRVEVTVDQISPVMILGSWQEVQ
jgi:CBS domain containing-hemolysin-like protein